MSTRSHAFVLGRLLLPVTLLVIGACKSAETQAPAPTPPAASDPNTARISNGFTASAEVVSTVPAERKLTLRREDGNVFEVQVDPVVRNYDQIVVGDTLRVRYQETLVATKMPAGSTATPITGALTAARAKQGAKPGAGVGVMFSVRVRVESVDHEREIVTYSLSSGELNSRRLQTPEGRAFAKNLKVGDIVQLDYAEALAMGIEKL